MRTVGMVLALVLAMGEGGPAMGQTAEEMQPPAIRVSGEGRVEAVPDMATLRVGVGARAETPGAAMAEVGAAAQAMLARMAEAGVAPRDLQTSELQLGPVWQHDRDGRAPVLLGYDASTQVTVRVRDLGQLGGLLDAAVAEGADRFDGLSFGLSETQALADEARRRAVADALRKAELYAEAAGVPLGPVTRITEETVGQPRPVMLRDAPMAMEAAMPVAEGELAITARVTVHFGPLE